ncbi:hypothetical protein FGO68_gene6457 [Halteria grandinella]|uniref:Uncharacterized protein n=1 Tax=Halteria grandinella TaxID=5974 RepID=A0A8J8NT81_HALGN|nr:hypothetical protein FGO68_gene6457 [Halteria grandinella]
MQKFTLSVFKKHFYKFSIMDLHYSISSLNYGENQIATSPNFQLKLLHLFISFDSQELSKHIQIWIQRSNIHH